MACNWVPGIEGCGSQFAMVGGWNEKKLGYRAVDGNERLKAPR